ncbi:hypothetical protein [Streptomyces roseolus]|uniref:hypothetical protein n=1 Tax=Streptomyces roseolus TaxID=67358 RepID=UPI0036ED80AF
MVITRTVATAGLAAALSLAGTAAVTATQITGPPDTSVVQADRQKPRPTQPVSPPGLWRADVERPDQANTPVTGRTNQFK